MTDKNNTNVSFCCIDLEPKTSISGVYRETSRFFFQRSNCIVRVAREWELEVRKLKVYVNSEPLLSKEFYATASVLKGNHLISFPKKLVQDPTKSIWSLSFSNIAKQLPGIGKWDVTFTFSFQEKTDVTCYQRNSADSVSSDDSVTSDEVCTERDSLKSLSEDFERLLIGEIPHDIQIRCKNELFKLHKLVLMVRSEFFKNKLRSSASDKIIEITGVDPEVFMKIVQYMYKAKLPDLNLEIARKIYATGDICNIGCLREQCINFLIADLKEDNACDYLTLACEDDTLKEKIIEFMIEKNVPLRDDWLRFCANHKSLAIDVLNKSYRRKQTSS